jgi:hypothetical protein
MAGPRVGGIVGRMRFPSVRVVVRVGIEQVETLVALPGTIVLLNRSLTSFAQTVQRLDELVRRLDRLTQPLEAPIAALAPRLEALAPLLDEELIESLAATLESVPRTAVPALELLSQSQAQMASIATALERLTAFMEAGYTRLQNQPAATLAGLLLGTGSGPKGSSPGAGGPATEAGGTREGAAEPVPGRPPGSTSTSNTTEEHRSWRA